MPSHRAPRGSWFGRGRTRALLSAGLLVGMGAVATSAYWTTEDTFSGGPINAGAIHLDLANNVRVKPETYGWGGLALSNLAPGDTRAAVLPVTNNSRGAVTFSYRIQASATGTLGGALQVTVRRGGGVTGTTCTGGTLVGGANASLNGFDQPAGASLAPTQAHDICVQVTRPAGVLPASSTSNITFTFPASQVP
ncbi:SipW-dependent-type signal peptide-containing protein [Nocardioides sp. Root190]|uniref:SipW-dependent-type signal peptide-containing protein n=1 Tax=Nocardioides sp. Root190 TaxID=1736488 RepID=UPI000B043936|nr:SipW-dependent-type signal peptide-containing protein [Nocardioides sp. Root190]